MDGFRFDTETIRKNCEEFFSLYDVTKDNIKVFRHEGTGKQFSEKRKEEIIGAIISRRGLKYIREYEEDG